MNDVIDREILLHRKGQWLALESDYWLAMLRLIWAYGLDPDPFRPPPSGCKVVSADASKQLIACLENSLDDIPDYDLWRHYGNEPDPVTTPPHEYFSGGGTTYLIGLTEFVGGGRFSIEVTEPKTEYCFLGAVPYKPGG